MALIRLFALALTCLSGVSLLAAAPVRVVTLNEIAIYPEHTAPATVVSNGDAVISAELGARVVEFAPRVGDIVEQGAVLARLDCRDYDIELEASRAAREVIEARLKLAERRLERAQELGLRNSIAVEAIDERSAERAVLSAELKSTGARIRQAVVAVSRCVIRAPFRALLRTRLAPLGAYVARGDPIARVIDVDDLELSARIGVDDVPAVTGSEKLEFVAGTQRYAVRLRQAVAAINTETRDRELRLGFNAAAPLAGRAGQLRWRDQRPHLPGKYLVRRDSGFGFFVVADGRARFVSVAQAQAGRASAVDLDSATRIVIEGHYALNDGDAVELLESP